MYILLLACLVNSLVAGKGDVAANHPYSNPIHLTVSGAGGRMHDTINSDEYIGQGSFTIQDRSGMVDNVNASGLMGATSSALVPPRLNRVKYMKSDQAGRAGFEQQINADRKHVKHLEDTRRDNEL